MSKRQLRKKLYTDMNRDLSFRLAVFFHIYSLRPVEETKVLKLSNGDKILYFFEQRHNLYNPLTWLYMIALMFLNVLVLFISDFLTPFVEGIVELPQEIKATQQWKKRVLNSEVYNEVKDND